MWNCWKSSRGATRKPLRRYSVSLEDDFQPPCLPPDPALAADVREKVAAAFTRLPVKLRVAATLAMVEETPYGDIAEALGISVGTVKSRVFRAVRLLRGDLQRMGVEP